MTHRILFIAEEAGAAAYLRPLWKRLAERGALDLCRVVLGEGARRGLGAFAATLPTVEPAAAEEAALAAALAGWQPSLVLASATSSAMEFAALEMARAGHIGTLQFVDTWNGYRRRLEHDGAPLRPDALLVINERAREEAIAEGLPAPVIRIIGQPAWEIGSNLPPAEPAIMVFADQPVARFYGNALGYDEVSAWDLIAATRRAAPDLFDELLFAPHPAREHGDADGPEDCPEDCDGMVGGAAGLARAGTVLGMFSSLMTEALLGGRRVISVQPGAVGPDMCPHSRHALIPRVGTPEALVRALQNTSQVQPGDLRRSLAGSCERLADVIDRWVAA